MCYTFYKIRVRKNLRKNLKQSPKAHIVQWVCKPQNIATLVLWLAAAVLTIFMAHERYAATANGLLGAAIPGTDFRRSFLHAAQAIAAGHSPYTVAGYVYPPFLALALVPFSHVNHVTELRLWRVWVAVMVISLVLAVMIFILSQTRKLKPWLWPVLFAFCAFTVLCSRYFPVSKDLLLGQADTITFPVLLLSVLAASRDLPVVRGVCIGVTGLLKTWPGAIGATLFQRDIQHRWRSLLALGATLAVAPILTFILWGGIGIHGFIRNIFGVTTSNQAYINDSAIGATKLLFTRSGIAKQLYISRGMHYAVLAILIIWIVGLLIIALRSAGDSVLCTFHVTFCILLLLPVSHRQYAIYVLPILWIWVAHVLQSKGTDRLTLAVAVVMLLWWINQLHAWPDVGSSIGISAVHYCVPFMADLVALTLSVIAAGRAKVERETS